MKGSWLALFAAVVWAAAAAGQAAVVESVRFRQVGAGPMDDALLRAHVSTKAGQELDRTTVAADVKTLLATGRFRDVRAQVERTAEGVALIYEVEPRLKLVSPVRVEGANRFRVGRIREWLDLEPGDYLDEVVLASRAARVREEYRKKYFPQADVSWEIRITDPERGLAAVDVFIREGPRAVLRAVRFKGRKALAHDDVSRAFGQPVWWNPFRVFMRSTYDPQDVEAGMERLRQLYRERGFYDVKVGPPMVRTSKGGRVTVVDVPIEEGARYRLGQYRLKGVTLFPEEELLRLLKPADDAVASQEEIQRAANLVRDYLESRGYMYTWVEPALLARPNEPVVDVELRVREGRRMVVNDVLIRGNRITRDKVIRRELLVRPGDEFDGTRIRTSENRLRNLGFFSSVQSYDERTAVSNRSDLVFEVEEQKTGQFMVGAGFSSIDDLIGFAEISQGNFDIRGWPFVGGGQKLKLRAQWGTRVQDYSLSFVEPWFLDRQLSLGFDLYSMQRDYDDYYVRRQGAAVSLGKALPGPNRLDVRYRLEGVEVMDAVDTNAYHDAEGNLFFFNEEDRRVFSSLSATWSYDTRDNFFVPTRGSRVFTTATLMGGPLGFDTDLYGFEGGFSTHVPLWRRHVLNIRLRAEVVDAFGDTDDVPLSERLFAGGSRTVRGFKYRWVGPKAERVDDPTRVRPTGGQSLAVGTIEYTVPLAPRIRAAAFVDAGNVWHKAYHFDLDRYAAGAGVGIRFDIPGFPIRIDYSEDIHRDDPRSRRENVSFAIGYSF